MKKCKGVSRRNFGLDMVKINPCPLFGLKDVMETKEMKEISSDNNTYEKIKRLIR